MFASKLQGLKRLAQQRSRADASLADAEDSVTESHSRVDVKRVIEMLVFALAAPIAGMLLFTDDPLGINSGFPWAVIGPIIFAARYGVTWGSGCALVGILAILYPHGAYEGHFALTIAMAVGTLVLSIIVGDASSNWRQRAGQASAENQYLRHRLKEFSNDYHVLKVSHGQLEEYMAGQKLSLRHALQQLKPVLSTNKNGMEAGAELMAVFSQFCSVQVAGLYAMKNEKLIDTNAVAIHGNMGELPQFDNLLKVALKEGKLVSVKLEALAEDKHQEGLLAVVPIVDSNENVHGVLAIRDMHFMAFQQENLNLLSLLGGYIGDMLSRSRGLANSRGAWFMAEVDTALRFARTNSVRSSLLCMRLRKFDGSEAVAESISSNLRSLDASWQPKTRDGGELIVILLPLIAQSQAEGYLGRVSENIQREFGVGLDKVVTQCRVLQVDKSVNRDDCIAFIQNKASSNEKSGISSKAGKILRSASAKAVMSDHSVDEEPGDKGQAA